MKAKLRAENNYKANSDKGREEAVTLAVQRMINRKYERTIADKDQ